jgi:hypothetical protein
VPLVALVVRRISKQTLAAGEVTYDGAPAVLKVEPQEDGQEINLTIQIH